MNCGNTLIARYRAKYGVTEDLKAHDQMEWVRRMNCIGKMADEVVRAEVIEG